MPTYLPTALHITRCLYGAASVACAQVIDPEVAGGYTYSTGYAALRFLHEGWPSVPVLLLGFGSHAADQPHHSGPAMSLDMARERRAIDELVRQGGVERCDPGVPFTQKLNTPLVVAMCACVWICVCVCVVARCYLVDAINKSKLKGPKHNKPPAPAAAPSTVEEPRPNGFAGHQTNGVAGRQSLDQRLKQELVFTSMDFFPPGTKELVREGQNLDDLLRQEIIERMETSVRRLTQRTPTAPVRSSR
jgi:hypothetical protein